MAKKKAVQVVKELYVATTDIYELGTGGIAYDSIKDAEQSIISDLALAEDFEVYIAKVTVSSAYKYKVSKILGEKVKCATDGSSTTDSK